MARCVVCVGVPANLEVNEYETKDGEARSTLRFVLAHPSTAVNGSVQFEARRDDVKEAVTAARENGEIVEVVCVPDVVDYTNKDGEPARFFKLVALAVVPTCRA